jgi:hypothetical protein
MIKERTSNMTNLIELDYTNWKGVRSKRNIIPIELQYTSTQYHPEAQWLLVAFDKEKNDIRSFAVRDIHFPIQIDKCWQTNYGDLSLLLPIISEINVVDKINIFYSKEYKNNAILPSSWFTDKQDPEAIQRLKDLSEQLRNNKEE